MEVWKRATELWKGVEALLAKRGFQRDLQLRDQLRDAADSALSNITEGFEQPTDRAFAKDLYDVKASAAETRQRLWMAAERRYITNEAYVTHKDLADEGARMAAGLIRYLLESNRRDRGVEPAGRDRRDSLRQFPSREQARPNRRPGPRLPGERGSPQPVRRETDDSTSD